MLIRLRQETPAPASTRFNTPTADNCTPLGVDNSISGRVTVNGVVAADSNHSERFDNRDQNDSEQRQLFVYQPCRRRQLHRDSDFAQL